MIIYDRHSISVGSKVIVRKLCSGVEPNGLQYWKFYVPFTMRINGNAIIYKHLWCKVLGRPFAKEGDWVEITKIVKLHANCKPKDNGGMQIFEDFVVEVEKLVKETNDYE